MSSNEPPFNSRSVVVLGCVTITPDTYRHNERHHEIADRVMATHGYEPNDVTEIRLTETCTEVDWRWRDGHIRTTRYEAVS